MNKIYLITLIAIAFTIVSCKSEIEKSADDFCACFKMESMKDVNTCTEEWEKNYKGIEISDDEIKEMEKRVEDCDGGLTAGRYGRRIYGLKK